MNPHDSTHSARPQSRKSKPPSNGSRRTIPRKEPVQDDLAVLKSGLLRIYKKLDLTVDDIVIFLWGAKNLTYVPSEYRVGPGGKVHWRSLDGPFTITALGSSPFEKVRYQSDPLSTSGSGDTATARVRPDTPKGTYRYAIALTTGDGKIYVDPSCPPIIVE